MVASYLCFNFCIFDRPILEYYVPLVERGPHLLQFSLPAMQDGLPVATRDIHPSFENLVIINALGRHASLMDFHHNTSLGSILEDDSISSTSTIHIFFVRIRG